MMPQQNYAALVRQLKEEIHLAGIAASGILICIERNKAVAQCAPLGVNEPIGESEYQLTEKIPAALKGKLPTINQIKKQGKI